VTILKLINELMPVDPNKPIIYDSNIRSNSLLSGMDIPKDAFNEDGSPDFEDDVWWPIF